MTSRDHPGPPRSMPCKCKVTHQHPHRERHAWVGPWWQVHGWHGGWCERGAGGAQEAEHAAGMEAFWRVREVWTGIGTAQPHVVWHEMPLERNTINQWHGGQTTAHEKPRTGCSHLARLACGPGCFISGEAHAARACCRTNATEAACMAAEAAGVSWKPRQLMSTGTKRQATSRRPIVRQAGSAPAVSARTGSKLECSPASMARCSRRMASTIRVRCLDPGGMAKGVDKAWGECSSWRS